MCSIKAITPGFHPGHTGSIPVTFFMKKNTKNCSFSDSDIAHLGWLITQPKNKIPKKIENHNFDISKVQKLVQTFHVSNVIDYHLQAGKSRKNNLE